MNGQPTAQNTRECGVNGEFVAFRNWQNPEHVAETARIWNVEPAKLPDLDAADPRDADLPARGDGLDPAPLDHRHQPGGVACRSSRASGAILGKEDLFVVVSDAFLTETAAARRRGAPGGHLGREDRLHDQCGPDRAPLAQAVEPPGEARSDLDILLDYARRMDFRDKRWAPLDEVERRRRAHSRPGGSAAADGRATTPA